MSAAKLLKSKLEKNILISGCFFYPVYFSCVDSIPWFESKNLFELTISAEIFNKSFPSYNGFLTSKEYIKNLKPLPRTNKVNYATDVASMPEHYFVHHYSKLL